jgi:succinate dehydrogenase flavin-adding protein (antitoxin of CptAB toxin-antitoxin module)
MNLLYKKIFISPLTSRRNSVECLGEKPTQLKRLLYRANKRGMRETEEILGNFFEHQSRYITDADIKVIGEFLDEPDPDILKWIVIDKSLPDKYRENGIIGKLKDYWCNCTKNQS